MYFKWNIEILFAHTSQRNWHGKSLGQCNSALWPCVVVYETEGVKRKV